MALGQGGINRSLPPSLKPAKTTVISSENMTEEQKENRERLKECVGEIQKDLNMSRIELDLCAELKLIRKLRMQTEKNGRSVCDEIVDRLKKSFESKSSDPETAVASTVEGLRQITRSAVALASAATSAVRDAP